MDRPLTQQWVSGYRFHRTAARQRRDYERDQAHPAAGFTPLRFTHWQIAKDPAYVAATLGRVARRLKGGAAFESRYDLVRPRRNASIR